MTSTQALLSNTLEEIQDGQSLGCFQIQGGLSFDLSDRQSLGGFQAGESSDCVGDPPGGQSPNLQNRQNGNPGRDAGVELLEEYDAETELDEDSDRIKSKLQDEMVVGAGRQVSGSEDPQDGDDQELFLDDVNGFIHQTNTLDPDDFEGIQTNNLDPDDFEDIPSLDQNYSEFVTVADLQKEVSEQITEFDATWYGDQSQAVEEKNSDSKEKEGNLMETELEEREMLEKRREDLLTELRKQSESNLKMPTFKLPTFSLPMGISRAKTVPNMTSNNVTLVGRSVQVITLTHNLGFALSCLN